MGPGRDPSDRAPLSDEEEYQELLLGDLRRRPPVIPKKPRVVKGETSEVGDDEGYVALAMGRRPEGGGRKGWRAAALALGFVVMCLVLLLVLAVLGILRHCVIGK